MRTVIIVILACLALPIFAQDGLERFGRDAVDALKAERFSRFVQLQLGDEDIPSLFDSLHASSEWADMHYSDRITAEEELRGLKAALIETDSEARRGLRRCFDSILVRGSNLYGFDWENAGYIEYIEGRQWSSMGLSMHDGLVVVFEAEGVQYRLAFGRLFHTRYGWRLGPDSLVIFVIL
ncbi:MAG: hypothetical protein K8R90_07035 [Candidatus Cloacimonetes bacterium]|nr:hypothetical protein [Candidatus Cloacimonadota bacterium]